MPATDRMQYVNMDERYRPEVVYFDGVGDDGNMGFFLEMWLWKKIVGKPKEWYDRLNEIQNKIAVMSAKVSAFGKDVWNAIHRKVMATGDDPTFPRFDPAMNRLTEALKSIIVTESNVPSDSAIKEADRIVENTRGFVATAQREAPELNAEVEAEAAKTEALLSESELHSPQEVGRETFIKEIKDRSSKLLGGLGIGAIAIGGVALAVFLISQRPRPRRNPCLINPRRRKRGMDVGKLALWGGIGYLAYSAFAGKAPGTTAAAAMPETTAEVAPPKSFSDLLKRIDDLKTLWRSGQIRTTAQIHGALDALSATASQMVGAGAINDLENSTVQGKIKDFKAEI